MLEDLAERHREDVAFISAYCRQMAAWMEESRFGSGCPIATTMLETVPQSVPLNRAGHAVMDRWVSIIAQVFARSGMNDEKAKCRAETLIAAMEGALLLARIRGNTRTLRNVEDAFANG